MREAHCLVSLLQSQAEIVQHIRLVGVSHFVVIGQSFGGIGTGSTQATVELKHEENFDN